MLPAHIKSAILSGPIPQLRDWRKLPTSKLTRAERNMRFAEKYLCVPEGKLVGQPLVLDEFQEAFFYSVFDNAVPTRIAILSMARKNAKTATIAIIVLVYLVGPEAAQNSRLSSGAMARKQAAEVFNYASKMARLSAKLKDKVRAIESQKKLIGLPMATEYEALAAEGATAHGGSPVLVIIDEAGQSKGPSNSFFEALTTSQGAHEFPLEIWISTQAATDGDLFNMIIDDAEAAADPSTVCHVYRAPEDCELSDTAAWQAANPALGKFKMLSEMVKGAKEAERLPTKETSFRWLHLNQRVNPYSPFISRNVWKENGEPPLDEAFARGKVYGGLDLSATTDLTAFVLAALYQSKWHLKCWFFMAKDLIGERAKADRVPYDVWAKQGFLTATPGKVIGMDWVAKRIVDEAGRHANLEHIAFDRWKMPQLQSELDKLESTITMIPFGQGFASMTPAVSKLEEVLLLGEMRHGNNPVMTMCFNNTVVINDPAGNRKFDKAKSTGRIDGSVATAMAIGSAISVKVEKPKQVDPARRSMILV